jgi:hypothetical protein
VESQIRDTLLEHCNETIAAITAAGAEIAEANDEPITEGETVRLHLERRLRQRGLVEPLLSLLRTGASVVDGSLQGSPVPAPPYVVVTSRGPLCRGTFADGRRLVVEILLFSPRGPPRRYRACEGPLAERLQVQLTGDDTSP